MAATASRNGRSVTAARSTTVPISGGAGILITGTRNARRGRARGWMPTVTAGPWPSIGARPIVSAVATRVAPVLFVTPPTAKAQLLHVPRDGIQHTSHTKSWQAGQKTNR